MVKVFNRIENLTWLNMQIFVHLMFAQNKKLLLSVSEKSVENEEDESCGYVTEEDESESDRSRKNHKRVSFL